MGDTDTWKMKEGGSDSLLLVRQHRPHRFNQPLRVGEDLWAWGSDVWSGACNIDREPGACISNNETTKTGAWTRIRTIKTREQTETDGLGCLEFICIITI